MHQDAHASLSAKSIRENNLAMQLSLSVGGVMFAGKVLAYVLTGSAAVFSDAAESVVHLAAVAFAAFSLWLSAKPVSDKFTYGYERISFFSAGFEGAMIILAALTIIYTAIDKWIHGIELEHIGLGALLVAAAGFVNGLLGWYLIRIGKRNRSIILEANGRHVLTDSWTSAGVIIGLLLVWFTDWKPFDPIMAILVAGNILWSGSQLVRRSIEGLMDYSDPEVGRQIRDTLDEMSEGGDFQYHGVRFRDLGHRLSIELHLLFPYGWPLGEAHRIATDVEDRIQSSLDRPTDVVTHLEAVEDHGKVHPEEH
ncbi:MAG: cation transporter [Acidobacteriota bacterium]|nr:MAG: cation transporter [Acidobacteriota bacterium]